MPKNSDRVKVLDLNSYKPPQQLHNEQIWTLVISNSRQEKVSEYNWTKKKMPLLSWPGVLKRYNENPKKYAPVTGIVSREIFTIDIDTKATQPEEIQKIIKERLPDHFQAMVEKYPTHHHKSKSGNGWKIYYITDTPIPKKSGTHKRDGVSYGEMFQGMFVSTTDPELSDFSRDKVASVTRQQLAEFLPEIVKDLQPRETKVSSIQSGYLDMEKMIKETKRILAILPVDPDPLLEVTYETRLKDFDCNGYNHWLLVSHALCDLTVKLMEEYPSAYENVLQIFIEWSIPGQSFQSEEECVERFERSYNETVESKQLKQTIATYQTLRKLFWGYRIPIDDFPVVRIVGKDKVKMVDATDPENFEFLTELLQISIKQDYSLGQLFIHGPPAIIRHYFSDKNVDYLTKDVDTLSLAFSPKSRTSSNLQYRLVKLYRHFGIKGALRNHPILAGLDKIGTRKIDTLYEWFVSKKWDQKPRALKIIEESVTIEEALRPGNVPEGFYHQMIFKHLIHMAGLRAKAYRAITNQPLSTDRFKKGQGILILAGYQNTRKSTWIECLLPSQVPLVSNVTPSSMKDTLEIQRALASTFILNIDEIDAIFDNLNLSDLKNVVTQDSDTFRTMYTQQLEKNPRAAGMFGTTNKRHIKLDRTGNRRFWIIPIKQCNAETLVKCDYQQMWAELLHYAENLGMDEWNLNNEEKIYINSTASQYSKQTLGSKTIDTALTDIEGELTLYDSTEFDFDGLFNMFTQPMQRRFIKEGLFFSKRGNKAFLHLQNSFIMDDNIDFKLTSFDHEIGDLLNNAIGIINETREYRNMFYTNGVVHYYARGRAQKPQSYHFIPYKDKLNLLLAKEVIPKELFLKKEE